MLLVGRLNKLVGSTAIIEMEKEDFYEVCREQFEADLIECQRDIKNYAEVIKKMDSRWNELRDVYLMSLTQTEGELKDAIRIMNDQIALMKKIVYRYD